MLTQPLPPGTIPKRDWPPGVLTDKTNFNNAWAADSIHYNPTHTIDPDTRYHITHTSFTLHSALELPSFSRKGAKIFDTLTPDVPGYVAHTRMMAPLHLTLDTVTVWTSERAQVEWIMKNGVHREAVGGFYGRKAFHKSPRHKTEKFVVWGRDLPRSGAELTAFWKKVNNLEFQEGSQ